MKVYKTSRGKNIIAQEMEVERVTDSSIFWTSDRGRKNRELKVSSYGRWHDSKEDAMEYLRKRIIASIEIKKEEIKQYQADLENIISLQHNLPIK